MFIKYLYKQNLNIKIIFPIALIQVVLVGMLIYLLLYLQNARSQIEADYARINTVNLITGEISQIQKESEVTLFSFLLSRDYEELDDVRQNFTRVYELLAELDPYIVSARGEQLESLFMDGESRLFAITQDLVEASGAGDEVKLRAALENWLIKSEFTNAALQDLINYNLITLENSILVYEGLLNRISTIAVVSISIAFLFAIFLYFYLRLVVSEPLKEVTQAATRFSEGYFNETLEVERTDELGRLATNLNKMAFNLQLNYHKLEREIKQKEEALAVSRELERRKDDFISMSSHELKTPVTSIKVFTQILEKSAQRRGDETDRKYLLRMNTQIDRLTNLINELLDVSRIQGGRLELEKSEVNLNSIAEEVVENIQETSPKHKIIFETSLKSTVYCDANRLGQVMINLLTNAVKYSPENTQIIMKFSENDENVLASVQDFGMGIPKMAQSRIFERFYRVYDKNEKTFPGLGMGLYISSEIVRKHGGKIWVVSKEGKGSTFHLTLPKNPDQLIEE